MPRGRDANHGRANEFAPSRGRHTVLDQCPCLIRVKSGHGGLFWRCPLYPQ